MGSGCGAARLAAAAAARRQGPSAKLLGSSREPVEPVVPTTAHSFSSMPYDTAWHSEPCYSNVGWSAMDARRQRRAVSQQGSSLYQGSKSVAASGNLPDKS